MRTLEEALFWEIFYGRQAIRSELARFFHVSSATISRTVSVLIDRQLVVEAGSSSSTRGRRPIVLQVNPALAFLGGVEFDRDRVVAVITDLRGNLLGRGAVATGARDGVATNLEKARHALDVALDDAALDKPQLARIGVGHTATLDVEHGLCLDWQGVPHWQGLKLREGLQQTFQCEVTLDDRTKAVALAHHLLSAQNLRHRSALYVHIGTGIGAGIFYDGRMLRGASFAGGEIGHTVIERNGPPCRCGRNGCVEAYASRDAIFHRIRHGLEQGEGPVLRSMLQGRSNMTLESIIRAARRKDALCQKVLNEAVEALGIGISNAAQLFNPSLVVLAGDFPHAAKEMLLDSVIRIVKERCFETISRQLDIQIAPFRKDVGAVGCAFLGAIDQSRQLIETTLFGSQA